MNQQPLTTELIAAARACREASAYELSPEEARAIAKNIRDGKDEADMDLKEYVVHLVQNMDVALENPETRSVFWSHRVEKHPEVPANEYLSNQHVAAAYTKINNAATPESMRYLEGTPGGQELDKLRLWDPQVQEQLGLDPSDGSGDDVAREAWAALSKKYAENTQGQAILFAGSLAPWSVAYHTELPALRQRLGVDNVHFMYSPPEADLKGLLPETQALLSEDRIRAQVHHIAFEEKTEDRAATCKAGYVNLDIVRALPTSEAQRAAILEACARVSRLDGRATDVERLVEEINVLRPDQEVIVPSAEELRQEARPLKQEQEAEAQSAPGQTASPAVITHGQFLPGVTVNAKVGPVVPQPLSAAGEKALGVVGTHDFLPGVTPVAKQITAPDKIDTPTVPSHAPSTPEQSVDTGMGV
ncbi:hypothetical protein [Streptomyces europaeiscabiei]|uniref:hypothetical protein n=1 Tax=Streptomyces europaeiscabiei TaxID=146819 RepID=UPI0029AB3676|nr:hypothetical protein [Streptomyces europaeiscabiei]MDX3777562.1 hypothetical protein [Streptomyces europaeiscabiei]